MQKKRAVTRDEVVFLIQHWDSLTLSQLSEDMSKLFGYEITRDRVQMIARNLIKRGCNLAKKPKERDSAYNLGMRTKVNVYDKVMSEEKIIPIKHGGDTTFYGRK